MPLPSSGTISLNEIHIEAGGTTGTLASINDSDIRDLIGKSSATQMSFSEWYGATRNTDLPIPDSSTDINGQSQYQEITVSDYITSGGQLTIPSSLWIWSDSTSTAALTIDIPCTIVNNGKILGKGGAGGVKAASGSAGGPAININSGVTGVTITNGSGAYIAGGGGGGGGSNNGSNDSGGGGGAGGGAGGSSNPSNSGGAGGVLNASGANGSGWFNNDTSPQHCWGGEAGGAGGYADETSGGSEYGCGAGGGGRIFPGTQTPDATIGRSSLLTVGKGGGGGQAGTNGANTGNGSRGAGGGGWGAAGGNGAGTTGGAAGKAIEDNGQSYTLNDSGTIYGATT